MEAWPAHLITLTVHRYRVAAVLVQLVVLAAWSDQRSSLHMGLSVLSLVVLSFTSGIISTASFALMMKASRESPRASSHHAALASVEIGGKLVFASLAGFLVEGLGMAAACLLFAVLCVLPCVVLGRMPRHLVRLKGD